MGWIKVVAMPCMHLMHIVTSDYSMISNVVFISAGIFNMSVM